MLDALLYAVRDTIVAAKIGYGYAECDVFHDGQPPPRMGNFFVAVHGTATKSTNDNCLMESYGFNLTLTARVTGPLDTFSPANNLARVPLGERLGFLAKMDQLRRLLHMNWPSTVLFNQTPRSANDNIAAWITPAELASGTVYGFVEPARYRGVTEEPQLCGGDWLGAEPDTGVFAIKTEIRFDGAKRMQAQTAAVGVFV